MTPIWLKRSKHDDDAMRLTGSEARWMARLSQRRLLRFGRIPDASEEWVRQIEECAAQVKAERGRPAT